MDAGKPPTPACKNICVGVSSHFVHASSARTKFPA